jgi:hypothetical protein
MEPIIGTPEARICETVYVTSVAHDGQMLEFSSWVRKNPLILDGIAVVTNTELRSGKLKRAELAVLIPLVEEKVKEIVNQKV